jgi:hypothetical protein
MEGFPMKWMTLKLEHIDEAGILQSTVVGFIERPELTSEADFGLTHDDGKYLIRQVQSEIAHDQVCALIARIDTHPTAFEEEGHLPVATTSLALQPTFSEPA